MLLNELFADHTASIVDNMRALMIDVLTPLAANKVPYITVQQVIDRLQDVRSGTRVDRSLIMTVLDPDKVQIVKKIEGDRIYLSNPTPDEMSQREDDEERQKDKIQRDANKTAQREVDDAGDQAQEIAQRARDALN